MVFKYLGITILLAIAIKASPIPANAREKKVIMAGNSVHYYDSQYTHNDNKWKIDSDALNREKNKAKYDYQQNKTPENQKALDDANQKYHQKALDNLVKQQTAAYEYKKAKDKYDHLTQKPGGGGPGGG